MIKVNLIPDSTIIGLDIPVEYIGKPVLVTIRVIDETDKSQVAKMGDFFGTISDETAQNMRENLKK